MGGILQTIQVRVEAGRVSTLEQGEDEIRPPGDVGLGIGGDFVGQQGQWAQQVQRLFSFSSRQMPNAAGVGDRGFCVGKRLERFARLEDAAAAEVVPHGTKTTADFRSGRWSGGHWVKAETLKTEMLKGERREIC